MAILKLALGLITASACTVAVAAASCAENIRSVILHANGNVYFLTDKTCNLSWCQINWGSEASNKNALAMLLLAKATSKPVSFYWSNLPSCNDSNPTYGSPDYMSVD
jgi:hypothetical protein